MQWTIKSRLLANCAVLAGVLMVACIIGWRQAAASENRIGGVIRVKQAEAARTALVQSSVQDLLNAHRAEKEFLLKKHLAPAQNLTKSKN